MAVELRPNQIEARGRLSSGKVLWGGVGAGKSMVALSYYFEVDQFGDLVVITTAKKRDSLEWMLDAAKLGIGRGPDATLAGTITVDSWNNIGKYVDHVGCTFLFDEQRLVGSGVWVKSFYKIARNNSWLILTATPGDTWMDYIPVFVANGYYKNMTEFKREHVIYAPFTKFPQIIGYRDVPRLEMQKREVLIPMAYESANTRFHKTIPVRYDTETFMRVFKERWNVFEDAPIKNSSEYWACLRRVVYEDRSRLVAARELLEKHPRMIFFYNYNYELEMLRELVADEELTVAEWNGHKKQQLPGGERWAYLVQYASGAEGWNCTETDAMCFYSKPYSYKQYEQSHGRIDRMDNVFDKLYYYGLSAASLVDRAVEGALARKEDFNESKWVYENLPNFDEQLPKLTDFDEGVIENDGNRVDSGRRLASDQSEEEAKLHEKYA